MRYHEVRELKIHIPRVNLYGFRYKLFAWYYNLVSNHYYYLNSFAFKRFGITAGAHTKEALNLVKTVSKMSCEKSGICAVKAWKPSDEIQKKGEQLAWKAQQEADKETREVAMDAVSRVVELTPEELSARKKAFDEINKDSLR